ncbi:tetratricopeptide repeat protein [Neolewinella sp.]|uniref:tetratricopeptide repeat protein n=1 Tax=Neolewinella sp. TaxID=2993543 RepID=UPI003B517AF1
MLIIPPYIRFALIGAGILGGIALWVAFGFWYGFPFLLAGLILLLGYIFLGTVGPAAKAVQVQDFDRGEKLLNLTLKPEWLYSANRAFYYMMRGTIALSRKDLTAAEGWLKKADTIDVPTANEKAMLKLQLAQIEANRKNFPAAKKYLKAARETNVKLPQIVEQMDMLDTALKQSGQVKAAQRMGKQGHQMMSRGGKRRRPKGR